jgi:hypothetical protein
LKALKFFVGEGFVGGFSKLSPNQFNQLFYEAFGFGLVTPFPISIITPTKPFITRPSIACTLGCEVLLIKRFWRKMILITTAFSIILNKKDYI